MEPVKTRLVLFRRIGDKIQINHGEITVFVSEIVSRKAVKIVIEAPRSVYIGRDEVEV